MAIRYLGVDLGSRRIGLAFGEPDTGVASPLKVLEARRAMEDNARMILAAADEYAADGIVIGLPLNMDGSEGPQAKMSRRLAAVLRRIVGSSASCDPGQPPREVYLHDERLTSHAADERLAERRLTRRQKRVRQDAIAAAILLQSFLENRDPKGSTSPPAGTIGQDPSQRPPPASQS